MFSGIIETLGRVEKIEQDRSNLRLSLQSELAPQLKIDQSIAHNGICLTVVDIENDRYTVVAIDETIQKTTIADWQTGDWVNLERCIALGDRVDGHMVQGHVDTTGVVDSVELLDGSWKYVIAYHYDALTVPKGSIAINGVSLTVVDSEPGRFSVCIIPYTYEHTTFKYLKPGHKVNLEFDIIGKYIAAYIKHLQPK
jgi:riboflavin synthase